jgi:hypothetical protein
LALGTRLLTDIIAEAQNGASYAQRTNLTTLTRPNILLTASRAFHQTPYVHDSRGNHESSHKNDISSSKNRMGETKSSKSLALGKTNQAEPNWWHLPLCPRITKPANQIRAKLWHPTEQKDHRAGNQDMQKPGADNQDEQLQGEVKHRQQKP